MKINKNLLAPMGLFFMMIGCAKAPVSTHKQLNLLPENEMLRLGITNYTEFLVNNPPVPVSDPATLMVSRVGRRIATAVEKYLSVNNAANRIGDFSWDFNVVNDKIVSSWCLPSGKVVVFSGLLPITHDETSLAWVIGHNIAHAITRHGSERMSQGLTKELGGMSLDVALVEKPEETQQIFMTTFGVANKLDLIVPFSKAHEAEADKLALFFMSIAGYNPKKASLFLNKIMQADEDPQNPIEFLINHPCDEERIKKMRAHLPEAMKYYKEYIIQAAKNSVKASSETPAPISAP